MGKVLVTATVENLDDLFSVRKGLLAEDQVRRVEVTDALVDTGGTGLMLPHRLIAQLGLEPVRIQNARHDCRPHAAPDLPRRPIERTGARLH